MNATPYRPGPYAGQELRVLRRFHNMTQKNLGETLGVTEQTIARWEHLGPPLAARDGIVALFGRGTLHPVPASATTETEAPTKCRNCGSPIHLVEQGWWAHSADLDTECRGLEAEPVDPPLEIQGTANRLGGRTISQAEFDIAKGHFRSTWNKTGHGGVTARTKAGLTAALSSLGIWVEA